MKEQIEKQAIEEIAEDLYHKTTAYNTCWEEDCAELAEILYNEGYRRQIEGEWIWKSNGYMNALHCSLCNKTAELHHNFCPNCGAKMKGGAE